MPLFVLACIDKPDALDLRMATREAHLDYVRKGGADVKLAGPFLDEEGRMAGSMFIIEAPDAESVRAYSAADPYTLAGVFGRVEVRAWKATIGQLP